MKTLTLKGSPVSTNTVYATMCRGNYPSRYMTNRGRDRKEAYQWEARQQWKGQPIKGDVELIIRLYFKTKAKSDWDNFHKISCDALTGIVWIDDSQIIRATVEKEYDKENPRTEIEVYDLSPTHSLTSNNS